MSQVLAYAAALQGFEIKALEQGPLRKHLAESGYETILDIVKSQDQEGAVEEASFDAALQDFLDQGRFRLVLVLDEVPAELGQVVAYLDAITENALTIDLIVVKVYDVNGVQVALPQRVSPDLSVAASATTSTKGRRPGPKGVLSEGIEVFRSSIEGIAGQDRETFDELIAWAEQLAALPNVRLYTYDGGTGRITLLPRIKSRSAGLVTIWNDNQRPYLSMWRSVFEALAPDSIEPVERLIAPIKIGQGNVVRPVSTRVLEAITAAYEETVERKRNLPTDLCASCQIPAGKT